ncbi:prepilin peptidase [Salmonella enterica]|uniref:prepilin peptidase n=1 Tax=Salmonella enterica TaxID=28901 RepID=UPI00126A955A|nr:prepilin peptidase [Salmonella enterica subsp. salamae]HAU3141200.1 prepilin peptidase [Salmonella enterica]HCL5283773.1 prepilin peptidase [Salmonella enterica]
MRMEALFAPYFPWFALGLGLLIGSFLNVVIYRLPVMMLREMADDDTPDSQSKINLWWPPSHCPVCKSNIKPWDNIPVISWLLLRGKCRNCACHIPFQYPLSEALIGIGFFLLAWVYYPHYSLLQIGFLALFFSLLYTLAMIDFKTFLLPDSLVFLLLWAGLIASVRNIIPVSPRDSVMGAAFIWGFTWLMAQGYAWISGREGFGNGDVKLFAACAVWVGNENIAYLMLGSAALGAIFFLLRKMRPAQDDHAFAAYIPFGPAIAITALVILHMEVLN